VNKCFLLILIVFIPELLDAQSFYRRRKNRSIVASFGMGSSSYFGELKNDGDIFVDLKYNLEFGLEYKLSPRISPKVMLTFFRLQGDDSKAAGGGREFRNLRFVSDNIELSAVGIVQLFEDHARYYQRKAFNAYAFLGLGVTWFNPRAEMPETDWNGDPIADAGKVVSLRQYSTEQNSYGNITLAIPFGLGIRYKLNPWFNIALDGGYRFTLTDYIDDVSTTYPGIAAFSDPAAAALSDRRHELDLPPWDEGHIRGNPDAGDGYFLINIKVEYYLPSLFGVSTGGSGRRKPHRR